MTRIDPDAEDAVEEMLDDFDEAAEHLADLINEEPRPPMGLHRQGAKIHDEREYDFE